MLRTEAVEVQLIRPGDTIFLNDLKSASSFGTFYRECYTATDEGAELAIDLQSAHVLSVASIADAYRIELRTMDQRTIDLELHAWQKLSVYIPIEVPVEQLSKDDEILLRGTNNPEHLDRGYEYALIAARYGCVSKILKIRKTWRGTYRMVVLFGNAKPLKLIVDPGVLFETAYSSKN